ncbi:hypothetical protein [Halomonas halocynthiae]|uniref:hypothetical protein n=1 Tax=Halomonas halocynthiae TaxID=176290 RepID=UPI0012EC30EA|nr:hypothetical protein [Halomonas halocynthiae]
MTSDNSRPISKGWLFAGSIVSNFQKNLKKEIVMFGLPVSTTLLVVGVPAIWVLYTLGFLWVTKNWPGLKRNAER